MLRPRIEFPLSNKKKRHCELGFSFLCFFPEHESVCGLADAFLLRSKQSNYSLLRSKCSFSMRHARSLTQEFFQLFDSCSLYKIILISWQCNEAYQWVASRVYTDRLRSVIGQITHLTATCDYGNLLTVT